MSKPLAILILILVGLAFRIPYMDQPIRFDEVNTYERYVSASVWTILSAYDAPNNHIFHSLLAHFTTIGSPYSEWTLRLPALLAGLALIVMVFLYAERLAGSLTGWLAGLLVAGSAHLILFSTNARGYGLVALCSVVSFACVEQLLRRPDRRSWVLYALSNIIGCFTIPIMVYPFTASAILLCCIPLLRDRKAFMQRWLKTFFITHIAITAIVILLYLPVILTTGLDALVGNRFVTKAPWDRFITELPLSLRDTFRIWFHDLNPLVPVAGLVVAMPALLHKPHRRLAAPLLVPLASLVAVSVVITLYKQVIPYPRVWIFLYPFLLILIAFGFRILVELVVDFCGRRFKGIAIAAVSLLITAAGTANLIRNDPVVGSPESGASRDVPVLFKWLRSSGVGEPHLIAGHYATPSIRYYIQKTGLAIMREANPEGPSWVLTQDEHKETLPYVLWVNGLLPLQSDIPEQTRFVSARLYRVMPDDYVGIGHLLNAQKVYFPAYFESSWYGAFSCDAQTGWILHEDHGRQHYYANDSNEQPSLHWLFDEGIDKWILLLPADYPKIYLGAEKRPLVWQEGTRSPNRVFSDPVTGEKISEAELRASGAEGP